MTITMSKIACDKKTNCQALWLGQVSVTSTRDFSLLTDCSFLRSRALDTSCCLTAKDVFSLLCSSNEQRWQKAELHR